MHDFDIANNLSVQQMRMSKLNIEHTYNINTTILKVI